MKPKMKMNEKINFKDKEAKKIFMRYALPCSDEERRKEIIRYINEDEEADIDTSESFPTATNMLKIMAHEKGEKEVDKEIIREYFWFRHGEMLKENNPDKDVKKCLVMPGKIKSKEGKEGIVELVNGEEKKVDLSTLEETGKGSWVVIHRDYASEKINEEDKDDIKEFLIDLEILE